MPVPPHAAAGAVLGGRLTGEPVPVRELTIEQVSPNDRGGGAERVADDLHLGLLARGIDAWLALGVNHGDLPNTIQMPGNERRSAWARGVLRAGGVYDPLRAARVPTPLRRAVRLAAEPGRYSRLLLGMEDFGFPATYALPDLTPRPPDVLHLHNLHGAYFDIRALPALARRVPVLITAHDVWLLTGHCAYPMECERWLTGCGACPALGRYVPTPRDASRRNAGVKRDALVRARPRVATPSAWLKRLFERSGLAEDLRELRVIPNGADLTVFAPGDREEARRRLGLPAEASIIVFAANALRSSDFKGFRTLAQALPEIAAAGPAGREVLMVAIGQEAPDERIEGVRVLSVPFVRDRETLASYYRAADLYLHPALAESFGLTVLEAMSCGTPVVASDVGGIPEVVEDGVTGLLSPPGDAKALAAAALAVLGDEGMRERMSEAGATRARERFGFERQLDAYVEWYAEIAEDAPRP